MELARLVEYVIEVVKDTMRYQCIKIQSTILKIQNRIDDVFRDLWIGLCE